MMKVLANMPQGLSPTQQAQARENINCKPIQAPLELTYADYGFLKKLTQDANGVVNAECSYISAATSDTTGLMSSSDKSKLDNIQSGAEVNQNAFSSLKVGATTIYADSKTDTLELIAGSNITLTPNANDDSMTISATDTTYTAGTGISISGNTISCTVAGGSQICTQNNGQAGIVEHPVSKLSLDTDFQQILTDGNEIGVYAPTPAIASTDKVLTVPAGSDAPMWMDTPSNAEFIQFTYGNETTAQDAVYTAVAAAYTAGKLPVLYCGVANATLYWFPTANGSNGYSFSRTVSNYSYVVTIDASTHVISHQSKEIINYTAGTNVSISANNEISATDTTYTAGSYINISDSNVISNTMHQDTYGLMISYNTLGNSGTTTHSIGPWRIQVTKAAMAAWDSVTGATSLHIAFAHESYLDGSITHGRILVDTLTPWADGAFSTVYTGHNQWGFDGTYAQGGSNDGFGLQLISPGADPDGNARACPKTMRGYHFTVNCGINAPDWLECDASLLYVNNNTSLTSNAARLLLRFKYFYV